MKKNSSMQGTLNKLFGKKNANNSLYASNPPWILPQGAKKADYNDDVHNSFAFLDDSGTATLKARPGPRVRPMLNFSTSNTDTQGLAVPTPSVPLGFTDVSLGNGPKMNGSYRMYSSVGDLRLNNYDDYLQDIPAPPSMPPPPPPPMAPPPPPPQKSPPSSAISSPSSPSPPDFIPPTPNSSAPMPPSFLPTGQFPVPTAEQHQINVAKWKSELVLNAASKELPMTLPNRLSLNPAAFQHTQGHTNFDVDPRSTLPKSFKIPPPAPARTSSIQLQEPQNIGYSNDPPQSPVQSSFNPSFQAKLFASSQGQQSLNDTLNKRKSVLIMEDLPDFSENSDQRIEKSAHLADSAGSRAASSVKDGTNILQNPHIELKKQIMKDYVINQDQIESASIFKEIHPNQPSKLNTASELTSVVPAKDEGYKYSQNGTERNSLTNKRGYTPEIQKTSKPTVKIISLKPIISELSLSNSNGSKHGSLTRKEMDIFSQELTRKDEVKPKPESSLENVMACPPTPPPPPPPPPPVTASQNRQSITPLPLPVQNNMPPKTSLTPKTTAPPPAPPLDPATVVRMPSPLLSPKPKTILITPKPPSLVPPPPPPKAPPAPPPLSNSNGASNSVPLLEALQAKQQSLRKIPKSIEVRPAQRNSNSCIDDDQKIRVGKIKGELEALFSPKKDDTGEKLKNCRSDLDANKNSSGNFSHSKGGENNLVNSLMLKVPLLPAKFEKDDVDADSEWVSKSTKMDIPIPEADYLPASPIHKTEKPTYSEVQKKIPKATLERSVPSLPLVPPQKETDTTDVMKSSIPIYKPHRKTKVSMESSTLDELPVLISKPEVDVGINLYGVPQRTEIATSGPSVKEEPLASQSESTIKHHVSGEQVAVNSPMALLMAAQKRAQKAKSLERTNLPKISVTNGLIMSSLPSPGNERMANTFPTNKENVGQFTEEEVTSFTSNSFHVSDCYSIPSAWRDAELQSSSISSTFGRNPENSIDQSSIPYVYNSADVLVSATDRHEDYLEPRTTTFDDHTSTTVRNSSESPIYNISSFPSPIPDSKMGYEVDYGIIPPPAEFMNSPETSSNNFNSMQQRDRPCNFVHGTSLQSDLIPNYDRSNSYIQPFVSLSTTSNSGFNNYTNDNYSTAPRDLQRGSLIKKRLYMPEPESSRNYGLNTSSLRSSATPISYSNMHGQSSSTMIPDPRRSSTTSRFLPQARRVSSENIGRIVPSMTDMKYKSQNADFALGKPSTRSQSKYQQGMTFTVRPGTRQPISQIYQGGYL